MNGAIIETSQLINTLSNKDWQIVGKGDYNADNKADILLRNGVTGQNWIYLMDGPMIMSSSLLNTVSNFDWRIVASADFDGNGAADILWYNESNGQTWMYLMNGGTISDSTFVGQIPNLDWQIDTVDDFDGDGNADVLWRNVVTGQNWLHIMIGATIDQSVPINTVSNPDWMIAASGDFDADDDADLVWFNTATGQVWMYLMNGAEIDSSLLVGQVSTSLWELVTSGDYDGDGIADILWRNKATGQLIFYKMNGAMIDGVFSISTVSNFNWRVVGHFPAEPASTGLYVRPSNTACIAPDQPTNNAAIAAAPAFPSLPPLAKPLALLQAPGDASQWYVVEQDGRVFRFDNSPTVSTVSTFIDIRGPGGPVDVDSSFAESGLLGMAFHPDYANNGEVFLSYTVSGSPLTSRISRFTTSDGLALDPNSEDVLLSLPQPADSHNGGHIVFGPDGFLYAAFGDGGLTGDPGDRVQNTSNLFGSMIRIDVDGGTPYGIPATNPNVGNALCNAGIGTAPCPEIYAWGFRNPWRWSFDSSTGELWLGDVGQFLWEEIDIVERNGNYGWRCREGAHDFDTTGNCPAGLIDPVIEYDHSVGLSVTGGFVYRGTAIPELIGRYVFADFTFRKFFASTTDGQGNYGFEVLLETGFLIPSLAEDENGELFFLRYAGVSGDIRKIVPSTGSSVNTIPDQLSATGCVNSANAAEPASGLIPYEINVPFWSDGAEKERFYSIPDETTIDVDANGDWLFPIGTVLMKNFRLNDELIETRLFMRHTNGQWGGYTYEWNQAGTDATRVVGGKVKQVQGQTWIYPSESQCMNCHTQTANFSLGLEHAQLNRDLKYPATGITANQLGTAENIGLLTSPLIDDPENLPRLYDLTNPAIPPPAGDEEIASRAYLHSNCSGCHRPLGPTQSDMDLRFDTALASASVCGVDPSLGDLGVPNAKLVAPGNSAESIIPNRMNRRDAHGMPPLASAIVDSAGVTLINQWIDSLTGCP